MHCHEWNRTNEFLLYGSITRKMIAGMIVTYARAPAALSESPLCAACGGMGVYWGESDIVLLHMNLE